MYDALVRFAGLAGLIEPSTSKRLSSLTGPACARIGRRARELREHLYVVLAATDVGQPVPQGSLDAIAAEVRRAHAARAFSPVGTSKVMARYRWLSPVSQEVPIHACALAIEALLVSADRNRIRKCGAADCEVYFIDTSKARRRQWCSMQNCGNREKQRRWRSAAD
jgi:predicted RNA-binding Zn ribbon-like protein